MLACALSGSTPARAQTVTEFPIPAAGGPSGNIASGGDGGLWFTRSSTVARLTTAGAVTEFPVTGTDITTGPDGNLWLTANAGPRIVRLSYAGDPTYYPQPGSCSPPLCPFFGSIAKGPDGLLWYLGSLIGTNGFVGRIATDGSFTSLATSSPFSSSPVNLVTGPDGAGWLTEQAANKIARLTPAGDLVEFPIPTAASAPGAIASGADGNLWFTETAVPQIGRITPAGVVTEFSSGAGLPRGIAAGPDGNLWLTSYVSGTGQGYVARITPAGVLTEFPLPTAFAAPGDITAGPDGAMWFAEAGAIGRVTTTGPARFNTVDPCRLVDTRDAEGPYGGPALAGGGAREFAIAGRCGIPAGATAVAVNITVTGPTSDGHLRLYPKGTTVPLASSINYVGGSTRANNAIVRLGYGGLAVFCGQASGGTHLVLDVTGYFE